jgi:hypothetical protein
MQKITTTLLGLSLISSVLVASETKTTTPEVQENTGEGFYLGTGLGASFFNITSTNGDYYIPDDGDGTHTIIVDKLKDLDDNDLGYLFYAGYQFNKIIGVEASYTDYGAFSGSISGANLDKFTKDPYAIAVAANAGYTFFNAQLRPFGLLGLAYLNTQQSETYDRQEVTNESVALHSGLGVEYYPTVLKGFGVRAAYTTDFIVDSDYETFEGDTGTTVKTTSMWQYYSLLYVGVQYKF